LQYFNKYARKVFKLVHQDYILDLNIKNRKA